MIEKSSKGLNMIRFPSEQNLILFLHLLIGELNMKRHFRKVSLREHLNSEMPPTIIIHVTKGFTSAFFRRAAST